MKQSELDQRIWNTHRKTGQSASRETWIKSPLKAIWEWFSPLQTAPKSTPTYPNPTWTAPERRHGAKDHKQRDNQIGNQVTKTEMMIAPIQNVADIFWCIDEKNLNLRSEASYLWRQLQSESFGLRVNWSSGGFTGRLLQLDVSNMISVLEDIRMT